MLSNHRCALERDPPLQRVSIKPVASSQSTVVPYPCATPGLFALLFLLRLGSMKALNMHASPPSVSGSSENRSKADESLYGAAVSDAFNLPGLSTAPPTGTKQRRTTCST